MTAAKTKTGMYSTSHNIMKSQQMIIIIEVSEKNMKSKLRTCGRVAITV